MSRLIAVSNRVARPRADGKAAGGLAVGVLEALKDNGGLWFDWNGQTVHGDPGEPKIEQVGNITFATIDLNEQSHASYYNGFSNTSLWPICHYLLGFFRYDRREFEEYRRVNALFARKLLPLLQPDDMIWVHDYHLIPLASELRRAGVNQPIGFFLHVPFPDIEVLRVLPVYAELIRCLCAYDIAGFQTPRDLRSFEEAVSLLGLGDRRASGRVRSQADLAVHADVFPIGIDVDACRTQAEQARHESEVRRLVENLRGRDLIIGVDRLDYSKGLEERFRAVERLFENHPSSRGEVSFLQVAPRTRAGVRAYDEIRNELEQSGGRINGRFAEIDWWPIRYLNRSFDRGTLMGFFRNATIGLVTPVRDGMNLVAKEFVAAQDPDDPGVLVLSRLAGAAHELDEALLVNPYDIDGVADAIQQGLTMPREERVERHQDMMSTLREHDITAWRTRFVEALGQSRHKAA